MSEDEDGMFFVVGWGESYIFPSGSDSREIYDASALSSEAIEIDEMW